MRVVVLAGIILGGCAVTVSAADDLKPYPPADEGYERMVFRVPVQPAEDDLMVEIVVGKTLQVDCNRVSFGGSLQRASVPGWGYSYYRLDQVGQPITTLKACPDDSLHEEFVQVRGEGFRQRYNSKLPVVVYVPSGFELRYRIWRADPELLRASPE